MEEFEDLINSYFVIRNKTKFSFKQKINSVLIDYNLNKKFYLLETIRCERININPLENVGKYSVTDIITNNKNNFDYYRIRTANLPYGVESQKEYTFNLDNKNILSSIKKKRFNEIFLAYINKEIDKKIFCEIKFELEEKKYSLFFESDYINFNSTDNKYDNFIQIAKGNTFIFFNDKIQLSNLSTYEDGKNLNTQFLINEKNDVISTSYGPFYKKILKKIIFQFIKKIKIKDKTKLIKTNEVKLRYFV